jgi:hypothetical protein
MSSSTDPMGPIEIWIKRNDFLTFYDIGVQYELPDIKALGLAPALGLFRALTKEEQRAFAQLALAYEAAKDLRDRSEITTDIRSFLLPILKREFYKYWRVKRLDTMRTLKHFLQTQLGMSDLPKIGADNSSINIKPFVTEKIRDRFADIDMSYRIDKDILAEMSAHAVLIQLYDKALRHRYGNANVSKYAMEKVNAIYTKRLESIEKGSGSPGTKKRRANALIEGQATHFQAPRWAGTKCDKMLGFSQHSGECATDAVQQIVLFADPWKNKIQPLVYDLTDANIEDLYAGFTAGPAPHPNMSGLRSLLLSMKNRFQNHYNALQLLSHEEDCVPQFDYRKLLTGVAAEASFAGVSLEQKKYNSAELGPSLKRGLTALLPNPHRSGTTSHTLSVLNMMFRLFGISYVECDIVVHDKISRNRFYHSKLDPSPYKGYTHLAFWLALNTYDPQKPWTNWIGAGHATAIYCCESIWYYYDNNKGIIKLHPRLMEDLLNEVTLKWYIGIGYTGSEIVFYKIFRFNRIDTKALPTQRVYYWNFTTQSWTPCLYKLIIERHSDQFFHLEDCIHIMTRDHRHTGYTSPYLRYEYVRGTAMEPPTPKSGLRSKSKSRKGPSPTAEPSGSPRSLTRKKSRSV